MPSLPLDLCVYIDDPTARVRCLQALEQLKTSGKFAECIPSFSVGVCPFPSEADIDRALKKCLESKEEKAIVLLSDKLSDPSGGTNEPEVHVPSGWAKGHVFDFQDRLFGTIAVTDRNRRIPDIDRTLRRQFETWELLEVLELVAQRLLYLRRPSPRPLDRPVVVRLIRTEAELAKYFRLRHGIYRIMGYLEPKVEFASSGMEMDWGDTTALHIGAFEQGAQREELVGTARVVSVEPLDRRSEQWTRRLASTDARLDSKLECTDPLILPILHSMKPSMLGRTYAQMLTKEPNCGELSRVIVKDEYRGTGLSTALIRFAILEAIERGVSRLLLECLALHQKLYAKSGFQAIKGACGEVPLINRTMIAMEMTPDAIESLRHDEAACQQIKHIKDKGYLCLCRFVNCQRDSPIASRRQTCPGRR